MNAMQSADQMVQLSIADLDIVSGGGFWKDTGKAAREAYEEVKHVAGLVVDYLSNPF